jgi:hypothetical protein
MARRLAFILSAGMAVTLGACTQEKSAPPSPAATPAPASEPAPAPTTPAPPVDSMPSPKANG